MNEVKMIEPLNMAEELLAVAESGAPEVFLGVSARAVMAAMRRPGLEGNRTPAELHARISATITAAGAQLKACGYKVEMCEYQGGMVTIWRVFHDPDFVPPLKENHAPRLEQHGTENFETQSHICGGTWDTWT